MTHGMFVFGVIPARDGSKGLPGKNLKLLGKLPLIGWTLRAAKESKLLSRTVVSTEDAAIRKTVLNLGGDVPFKRPSELARDESSLVDVAKHAVQWLETVAGQKADLVVLLQPTSPFRSGKDIDETIRLVIDTGADSAETVTEDSRHPFHRFTIADGRLTPLFPDYGKYSRRQDAPPVYLPSGAVYATRTAILKAENNLKGADHRALIRDFESSVDIDSIWDFRLAESILQSRKT